MNPGNSNCQVYNPRVKAAVHRGSAQDSNLRSDPVSDPDMVSPLDQLVKKPEKTQTLKSLSDLIFNLIPKRTHTQSESSYQMISSQLSVDLEKQGRVKQIFPEKLNPAMISRLQ